MAYPILLLSDSGLEGWWGKTILARPDFKVQHCTHYDEAFHALLHQQYDLCVVEQAPDDHDLPRFLANASAAIKVPSLRWILVSPLDPSKLPADMVHVLLHPPLSLEIFNEAAVFALHLQSRASRRYMVRIHLAADGPAGQPIGMATSVTINAGGMLIESVGPVPIGKRLMWTFSGIPRLKGMPFPGVVLKEEQNPMGGKLRLYIVKFDDNARKQRKVLADYLDEDL